MEGSINCFYGYFGTFKTLGSVALIKKKLDNGELVFSNIKINKNYFKNSQNYFYFDDIVVLHDILAFSGIFATKVSEYNQKAWQKNLPSFDRSKRPRINIIFDEMAVFADSSSYREFSDKIGKDLSKYLVQIRKLGVQLYMIIQKPSKLVKELRQYVEYWIRPTPKYNFLENKIIQYDFVVLNEETFKVETKKVDYISINGDILTYDKEISKPFFTVYWTPYYFNFYDDTFLNLDIKEIEFKTNFLKENNIYNKIKNGNINNKILLDNYKIYENHKAFLSSDNSIQQVDNFSQKPSFVDNPFYYFYIFIEFMKFYLRNPFHNTLIYFNKFLKLLFIKLKELIFFFIKKIKK